MTSAPPTATEPALHRRALRADVLAAALTRAGDRPALSIGGEVLTARQLAEQISRFAQVYASLGVDGGSAVATLSANRPEVLVSSSATLFTGSRTTNLHPMGSLDDHAYVLEDARIDTLVFDPAIYGQRAAELAERLPGLRRLLALGPSPVGTDVVAAAAAMAPRPLRPPVLDPDAHAYTAYTGGTTGRPKGVVHTHRSAIAMTELMMAEWPWPDAPKHLVCSPLSHAGASVFLPVLLRGGSLVVLPRFDAGQVLEAIQEHRITSTMLVPSMLYALLDHPRLDEYDLSSLQAVFYGASAISPTRLREAIQRIGPVFTQFYGQAEAPMTIALLRPEEHDVDDPERLAGCGRALPWLRVALLDDRGQEVPDGEAGEICVQGPLVMQGYDGLPEETAAALAGGWLHTGDVARRDPEGFLTIVDRTKDMIVSGGFNVYPREVELVLGTHPAVGTSAVICVPDERWGEAVTALVVLRPGARASAEELIALVRERKGSVHAPKAVHFLDELPLTAVGKPDKKALRARYWSADGRQVH
ncbi:AMP-binding protein [Blastococcus sp. SYSU D00820]